VARGPFMVRTTETLDSLALIVYKC